MKSKEIKIIKIGGHVIDEPEELYSFLQELAEIKSPVILVHGGGKTASKLAEKLGIEQTIIKGRRITDAATLDVTVMVYAGLINKKISATLQSFGRKALGICGADADLIRSKRRIDPEIDYGYVGDPHKDGINIEFLETLLDLGIVPVISPISHDGNAQLLNTNADTIAAVIAMSMQSINPVELYYCFEKKGVLLDSNDPESKLDTLDTDTYKDLCSQNRIHSGMLPKTENAFMASGSGVKVNICHYSELKSAVAGTAGTDIRA